MGEYINKKVGEISDLVKRKFKEVKKGNDYEKIYTAGQLAINEIVKQIKDDKSKVRGEWALAPLLGSQRTKERGLINEFKDSYKNVGFWENMFGENEKKISLVVNKIDNAENEVLKRLKRNRATQDSRQLVKKSGEQHKNNPMFVMEGGSDYKKQTGCLIFTKASNPVRIDQALRGLFDNPDKVYEIDYSGCTNQNIKNRMMGLCGTKTCYLRYDKAQRTYTIRDSEGNGISNRAYIWEGVKLIPAGIRQWQSYVEEKKGKGKLGEETVYNSDKLSKLTLEMFKDMPTMKAAIKKGDMTTKQAVQLCQKTEIRLNNLLKKARELGYELEPECVTKKWFGNGHMELHLNNGSSSVSWTVRGNDGGYNRDLGKDLDEFVDGHEEEYKTYLTKRVQSKWLEFDSIAKTEITDVSKKGGKVGREKLKEDDRKAVKEKAEQHKQQVLIGISILEQTVNNYDKGGNLLAEMKKLIRNAKVSIGGADVLDDNLITKNFIEPIREKWVIFKNLRDEYGNPVKGYANQHKYFKDIFLGNIDEQVIAMRELGRHGRVLDNTETSHLAEIIAGREDIGIKDAKVGECLDKIKNWTAMSIYDANGNINQKVKGWYDNTYASAKKGTDSLITLFVGRGWLPKNWKDEEKEVRKCMDNLKDKLNSINDQCNNISLSVDDMIKTQHEKRLKLEQKDNKTEEDMKVLQGLVYLEENPNKAKEIYKDVIEKSNMQLKYGDLGQVVIAGLLPALGELGGGITSNNDKIADIYNDIKGYGFWNLSDENAKLAGEIITEIAITVAVAVVTGGVGGAAMAAALRGVGIAAKGAKWIKLAKNIEKAIQLTQKYKEARTIGEAWKVVKTASSAGRAALGTTIGTGLLLEGTAFNAASNMVHSAMNGTSLDNLNLNPIAKENIQTAAFLGALSFGNKLGGSVMTKLHGTTKIQAFSQAGVKEILKNYKGIWTEGLISETVAMFGAEQGMNFVFGHDVINPETGEVETSRAPSWPTQQERCQMIGMILAFKVAKPGLWAKYEQKLNNGTLEICRGTGKNQVLIRDPQTGKVENVQDLIDGKESTKGNQGKSDGKAKGQIEKGKKSTSSERVQKAEEELNGIRDKITGVEARIKRIDGQIKNFEASREISNRERLAKDISKRRTYSENGNKPSDNIPINEHYEGRITDGKMEIIDKRTKKITEVDFDAKGRINDLINSGNRQQLDPLDIEIAERMIFGIKNGHAEVTGIEEAIKIKNGYPDMNLEIVGLENGNYGVRKKSNIRKLRQQKAELDAQLKGLKSEHRKKRTALNKEKKSQDKDNIEQKVKEDKEKQTSVEQNGDGEVRGQEQRQERGRNEGNDKIDKPEDVERDLEQLVSRMKTGSYESIKLDWVSQKMFETGVFIEGVHRRFKNLSLKPNMKLPKEFLERMRDKLVDMKNRWGEMLSEYHRKLVDKYNQYIEKKLAEKGDDVEIREEEINLVEKESGINEQNEKVEQKSLTEKERFAESMGSDLHEVWRKDYAAKPENIDADGRVKPRIRPTTDKEWIETHGGINDVDIYYTPFKELPLDRKKNNLDAAKVVIDLVYDKIVAGEEITPEMIEEMSATVHEEWLKRNGWAKGGKLDKPYYELPEVEKVKDRNQVLQAIEKIGGKQKRTEIERQFAEKGEIKESDKPEVIAEKLEESLDNSTDFEVSQEAFVSGKFIEGIKNRFNKIIQRPNVSLPRESVKRLSGKIKEMMDKRGNKLSDNCRNLTERFSRYLNDLLKQTGEKIKIKEQQRMERKEEKRRQREEQQRRQREEQQRREREGQQRRQREEQQRRQREEQQRRQREEQQRREREEQQRREREEQQRRLREEQQRRQQEEQETRDGQLKASDIECYERGGRNDAITSLAADLGNKLLSNIKRRGNVVAESGKRLCIIIGEKTCFIESGSDGKSRKENIVICVNKILPKDLCKTIFEKGKIFEMGPISAASHINEIIVQKSSAPRAQKGKREEQEKRQREKQGIQTEEGDDIIEAVEITGYQENIETVDGGRFTGEIKEGELYKGKFTDKNGNEWYIDKSSDYPVMRYQDKILLDRIGNKESINVGELKRTHRTNFNGLNKIIDSGIIGNNSNRGVQFWGGLGACYGEVAIIMKNSVMNLPPAPANIQKGHGNYDYFFSGHGAKDRNWQTFQKEASNFSYCRQEDPNIDVPYLSIGGKNGLKGDFAHEVGIEHVEAVILPTHVKNYPGYQELIKKLNDKGIKVIEAPTEENILDYAGGSVILAKDGKRGSFDKAIIEELAKRYPNIPTFEQQAITYLRETGRIKENDIRGKSFTEIREDYIKIANKNGFTRGSTRGGQYQNYSSQKNYTKEQQAYFKYIVKSRIAKEYDKYPNPKIKAIEENLDYPTGTEVYVKLEKGGETKAKVESYDTTTKEYTVRWEEGGQTLQKRVTTESLRKPGTSISILGISDPQTFINVAAELIKKGKSKTLIQDLKQELLKDSNKSELDHYKKTFLELQLRGENVDEIADYFRLRQSFNIGDFERNKEGVQKYYEEKIKPEMIETDNIKKKIMTEISSKTNGEPKDPPLKGAERASDRVIQLDYNFNSLLDVSRGTILYDNLDGVYNALNLILNHPEVKDVFLRDNFKIRSTGYRDINLAIKTRTGNCFELQLNTKKLFQAKEEGLTISKEFINSKLDKGETSNYFGIVEELYNGNKIFNETDIKIHEIINNKLKKDIPIPDINEPLTGHNLYELIRELNNISEGKAKQERELPNRLPTDSNISYQDLINYKNKITGFNNLLYDYASPT